MLSRYAKTDNKCVMIGKHWLIPGNLRPQIRKPFYYPRQNLPHTNSIFLVLYCCQVFFKIFHIALTFKDFHIVEHRRDISL